MILLPVILCNSPTIELTPDRANQPGDRSDDGHCQNPVRRSCEGDSPAGGLDTAMEELQHMVREVLRAENVRDVLLARQHEPPRIG